MFQRVHQYELLNRGDAWYRPRAYASRLTDARWGGWLVFFPLGGGPAIATIRETVQPTFDALVDWAAGITPTYLEGALERAISIEEQVPITAQLAAAEYEALDEAEVLESIAEDDLTEAAAARADAEALRKQRLATAEAIAAVDEAESRIEAVAHERAASQARATAADAKVPRMSQTDGQNKGTRRSRRKAR